MLAIFNTYILVGLACVWAVVLYFYWRILRDLHPNSRYRAYDMLLLTLFMMLFIGRLVAVIGDASYYFGATDNLQFLYIWDLNINYLVCIFIPLLAYQFEVFNIERNSNWKANAAIFTLFGTLLVLAIEIAQFVRGVANAWPQELLIYHVIQALILFAVSALILFQRRRGKQIVSIQLILIFLPLSIILLNLALPVLNDVELKSSVISQAVLAAVVLLPFISLPAKRQQSKRPNPGDFRSL